LVQLDEHDGKQLLESRGIECPAGILAASQARAVAAVKQLGAPCYIKALVHETNRAARGGIVRVESLAEVAEAYDRVASVMATQQVRVERAVDADGWWYVSIGVPTGADTLMVMFSSQGGSGIEGRPEGITSVGVDPITGLRDFHCRSLGAAAGLSRPEVEVLTPFLHRCYEAVVAKDLELLEVNPVAVTADGLVAVDARLVVDDYALFRQPWVNGTRSMQLGAESLEADLRGRGIEYVPLGGRIGIVGLGAGLTMHIADWIEQLGGSPSFFFDATSAAVRDWAAMFAGETPMAFAASLAYGLRQVRESMDVLLVNFTSGGTPVDALSKGLARALSELDWDLPTVVHVGGNRSQDAAAFLEGANLMRSDTIGGAVAQAVSWQFSGSPV
jgi:succinyl-CoA synthetase beta subunit